MDSYKLLFYIFVSDNCFIDSSSQIGGVNKIYDNYYDMLIYVQNCSKPSQVLSIVVLFINFVTDL